MHLEKAKKSALDALALKLIEGGPTPARFAPELHDWKIWLGLGYAVAVGWATYRGDHRYQITQSGIEARRKLIEIEE